MNKQEIVNDIKFLKNRLTVETLTSDKNNEFKIRDFKANSYGKGLEYYLKENAWEDDCNRETKVYLVKDSVTKEILFYFALSAGLVYKEIRDDDYNLSELEREIVETCVETYLNNINEITVDDILEWYSNESVDRFKLTRIIEEKIDVKLQALRDSKINEESLKIKRVSETFPGIVITHFCKNENATTFFNLSFPLGFYVFWEIIVGIVLKISKLLGVKYLYLFAADNTQDQGTKSMNLFSTDLVENSSVLKLVNYYKNDFKFKPAQSVTILKPYYDFECYSLVQPVSKLIPNRVKAWEQHLINH